MLNRLDKVMIVKKNQNGFVHLKLALMLIVVIGVIGLVFWRVSSSPGKKSRTVSQSQASKSTKKAAPAKESVKTVVPAQAVSPKKAPAVAVPDNCANYVHDTSGDPAGSLEEVKDGIIGEWIGCVTTPWEKPYRISIEFKEDGTYSTKYIGNEINSPNRPDWPALYYGTNADNPAKTYSIDGYENAKASGTIVIYFDGGVTNPGTLKDISLTGNSLKLNFWNGVYGPLELGLVRAIQN